MATRTLLTGSVLAAALLVGCSGTPNNDNASATETTPAGTSSSTTSTTSGISTTPSTPATTSSDSTPATDGTDDPPDAPADDTGSVQPASLDEQSEAWFGAFCTGLSGAFTGMMGAMGGAMGTAGATDPKATQAAIATAFQQVATSFSDTASSLEGLPAPTVENGDQLADDLVAALNSLGEGFTGATDTFAAADVTDEASLSAAMDAFQAETDRYGSELEAQFGDLESTLTPEITAAVEALPECQMMSS